MQHQHSVIYWQETRSWLRSVCQKMQRYRPLYRNSMDLPIDAQNQIQRDFLACTTLMHSSTGVPQTVWKSGPQSQWHAAKKKLPNYILYSQSYELYRQSRTTCLNTFEPAWNFKQVRLWSHWFLSCRVTKGRVMAMSWGYSTCRGGTKKPQFFLV